jgi:hypothetical protein
MPACCDPRAIQQVPFVASQVCEVLHSTVQFQIPSIKKGNLLTHIPLLVSYQKTVTVSTTFPQPNLRGAGGNKRNSQRTLYHYILNQPTSFEASIEYCVLMSGRLRMCHGTRKNRNRRHLKSSDIGALRVTNHRLGLNPAQENSNSTGILL